MSKTAEFLFELRTEEIPASYVEPALKQTKEILNKAFGANLLDVQMEAIDIYATCRRMIVHIADFPITQKSEEKKVKGPPVEIAYKEGKPTKALEGFLKKSGLSDDSELFREEEKGRELLFYNQKVGGRKAAEIIPDIIHELLNKLQFPKKMRWGDGDFFYPRPINGILLLLDGKTIPFTLLNIESKAESVGHFIQAPKPFAVKSAADLFSGLTKNKVLFKQKERRQKIQEELTKASQELGLSLHSDDELLDIVNYLVEDPHVARCSFPERFLEVPDAVTISEMREHQKYFSLLDKSGKLANQFLVVANMPVTEFITAGNERVLNARLEDGRFYYDEDLKKPLSAYEAELKRVVYQKEQGTVYEKQLRVAKLAAGLNDLLFAGKVKADFAKVAVLCKADLSTKLVSEFPGLQGHIGRIYAEKEGLSSDIAVAIEEHYRPVFQGDELPSSELGLLLSLADKLDNLLGNFSVGKIPTGSADPLGLRRQSMAVIAILLSLGKAVNIKAWLAEFTKLYPNKEVKTKKETTPLPEFAWQFISGRMRFVLGEHGIRKDLIEAALGFRPDSEQAGNIVNINNVARALGASFQDQSFATIFGALKRMSNILKDQDLSVLAEKKVDAGLFETDYEKDMNSGALTLGKIYSSAESEADYTKLFEHLNSLAPTVDSFFDNVMVNADNEAVKNNRLALLGSYVIPLSGIMDLSKVES